MVRSPVLEVKRCILIERGMKKSRSGVWEVWGYLFGACGVIYGVVAA